MEGPKNVPIPKPRPVESGDIEKISSPKAERFGGELKKESIEPIYKLELEMHKESVAQQSLEVRESLTEVAHVRTRFEKEHNGTSIDFYGIYHTPETWLAQGEELLKAITDADVVIIEGNPISLPKDKADAIADTVFNQVVSEMDEAKKIAGLTTADQDKSYLSRQMQGDYAIQATFTQFYNSAARISLAADKKVLSPDPAFGQDMLHMQVEGFLNHGGKTEDALARAQSLALMAAGIGGTGLTAKIATETAVKSMSAPNPKESKNISRRGFLKGLGAALGTGVVTGAIATPKMNLESEQMDNAFETDARLYTMLDYRNVVVARAIDEYTRQNPGKKILVIYGQAHVESIGNYLDTPEVASFKNSVYGPYAQGRTPQMMEYSKDGDGEWQEKALFEIK